MARGKNKLTALAVAKQKTPGRYADGGGLYLQISPTGSKSWLFRYTRQGKAREMGLGALAVVSLLQAREKAAVARQVIAAGGDPIETREADQAQAKLEEVRGMTFAQCADAQGRAVAHEWKEHGVGEMPPADREVWVRSLVGRKPQH